MNTFFVEKQCMIGKKIVSLRTFYFGLNSLRPNIVLEDEFGFLYCLDFDSLNLESMCFETLLNNMKLDETLQLLEGKKIINFYIRLLYIEEKSYTFVGKLEVTIICEEIGVNLNWSFTALNSEKPSVLQLLDLRLINVDEFEN